MSDHINGAGSVAAEAIQSGEHAWVWGQQGVTQKLLSTIATEGELRMVLGLRGRPFAIAGKHGGPPLMRATGATKAAADSAMNAYCAALDAVAASSSEVSWGDDQGRIGYRLAVLLFRQEGPRQYSKRGSTWTAWQRYALSGVELGGR